MKIVACIQARMGSSRLPGKVLMKIRGKTLIEIEFDRLKNCKQLDQIILATSRNRRDDVLAEHAKKIGLPVYRGSEFDLVKRFGDVARKLEADAIVRVTADNVLVDPKILDKMVKKYRHSKKKLDMLTNTFPATFPKGLNIEILSNKIFPVLDRKIKDPIYREIFTVFLMYNHKSFKISNFSQRNDLSELRWTVDYREDFAFVSKIFEMLKSKGFIFNMNDVLSILKSNPKIRMINKKRVGN